MTEKSELKNTLRLKRLGVKVILNLMGYFAKLDCCIQPKSGLFGTIQAALPRISGKGCTKFEGPLKPRFRFVSGSFQQVLTIAGIGHYFL
jgi:hypothetical protein